MFLFLNLTKLISNTYDDCIIFLKKCVMMESDYLNFYRQQIHLFLPCSLDYAIFRVRHFLITCPIFFFHNNFAGDIHKIHMQASTWNSPTNTLKLANYGKETCWYNSVAEELQKEKLPWPDSPDQECHPTWSPLPPWKSVFQFTERIQVLHFLALLWSVKKYPKLECFLHAFPL